MPERGRAAWFLRPVTVVLAVFAFGPFAIPLVFASPAFTAGQKWAITAVVAAITIWLVLSGAGLYRALSGELADLQALMR
jgi:hypothetical protein